MSFSIDIGFWFPLQNTKVTKSGLTTSATSFQIVWNIINMTNDGVEILTEETKCDLRTTKKI